MIEQELCVDVAIKDVLRDALEQHGRLTLKPFGKSMGAGFSEADVIVIEAMPETVVPVGTIIVFVRGESWIAHRVVRRWYASGGWRYLTWGDAGWPDPGRSRTTPP